MHIHIYIYMVNTSHNHGYKSSMEQHQLEFWMTGWPVKMRWVDGTSWSIGNLVGVPTDEVLESSQRCSVNMFFSPIFWHQHVFWDRLKSPNISKKRPMNIHRYNVFFLIIVKKKCCFRHWPCLQASESSAARPSQEARVMRASRFCEDDRQTNRQRDRKRGEGGRLVIHLSFGSLW